jgi:hypothetical protein
VILDPFDPSVNKAYTVKRGKDFVLFDQMMVQTLQSLATDAQLIVPKKKDTRCVHEKEVREHQESDLWKLVGRVRVKVCCQEVKSECVKC